MLIRFSCPACGGTHIFDMPETTIHMTCSKTHKTVRLRVTAGGDVKSQVVEAGGDGADEPEGEES